MISDLSKTDSSKYLTHFPIAKHSVTTADEKHTHTHIDWVIEGVVFNNQTFSFHNLVCMYSDNKYMNQVVTNAKVN